MTIASLSHFLSRYWNILCWMTKKIDLIICVRNWIAQEKILEGQNLPLVAVNPLDLWCLFQYRLLFLLVIVGVVRLFLNLILILGLVVAVTVFVAVNLRLCGVLLVVAIVMVRSRFLLPLPLATAIVIVIVAVIVDAVIAKMVQVQTQVVSETPLSRIPIVNLQSPVLAPGENSSSGSSLASVAHKSFALFSRLGTDS